MPLIYAYNPSFIVKKLPSNYVSTLILDNIAPSRGYPDAVRLDNGPEFISEALANWAVLHSQDEEDQERRYYQGPSERISLNQRPNT